MNGIDLKEMNTSDMLDVIHYFFEEDLSASSLEQIQARDRSRVLLYRDFYDTEYSFSISEKSYEVPSMVGEPLSADFKDDDKPIVPVDPIKRSTKPFIPATQGNARSSQPFGAVVDRPLTH